jgi:nucleotide-binding universal stress UspA family protein
MAIKDILLTLTTYPEPTSTRVVEDAVAVAAALGSHIAAIACETHVEVPGSFLSSSLVNVAALVAEEAGKSLANARNLLAAFETTAAKQGVLYETITERCMTDEVPDVMVDYAKLRDLTIVSVPEGNDEWIAEAIIFGSGRPTLVLPDRPRTRPFELQTILVAWDFSRAATRAVADAMPILEKAGSVRIVTVSGEKDFDSNRSAEELAKNLARHGIDVVLEEIDAADDDVGDVLESRALACSADLLVMGAYGHSRFREFILGGATRSMLADAPLPILFSH